VAGYYEIIKHNYTINRENSTAKIKMVVPWADAPQFCINMIGGLITINGVNVYQIGAAHPLLPGLYCKDVDIETFGNYDPVAGDFLMAWANITYGILDQPDSQSATQVGELSFETGGEEITLEKRLFTAGGNPLGPNDINPVRVNVKQSVKITYNNLAQLNSSSWIPYVGKVNSGTFKGYAAETVMFNGVREQRKISSDGTAVYTYEFSFEVRFDGWNKVFRTSGWVDINPKLYQTTNMDNLLPA